MGKVPLYGRSLFQAVMLTVLWVSPFDVDYTMYRGTSLIRNTPPAGPYSSPKPRDLWRSWGVCVSYERGTPVDPLRDSFHSGERMTTVRDRRRPP